MTRVSSQPIISVSGLRGVIGESLTPELASRYIAAYAHLAPEGPIVLSHDGRTTAPMLSDVVRATLIASGRDVLEAGPTATPTVGVLVRAQGAAGAVQISASHNPPEYNGIKLFGPEGRVIDAVAGSKVREAYLQGESSWAPYHQLGNCSRIADPHAEHIKAVLDTVDVARIKARKYRVLLDSNHGAGSTAGARLLEQLGCDVEVIGGSPDGRFEHPPEPTVENLTGIAARVRASGVDVGFCQDPDADRLALIDEEGRYVGEEYTLAITLQHALRSRQGIVVINCATSRMNQDLAQQAGSQCLVSAVGEANVTGQMIASNAVYGGEGNGGPIDPRVGYVRDSLVAMAQTLDAMALTEQKLSTLVDQIPRYAIVKSKASLSADRVPAAVQRLIAEFPDAAVDLKDGLRLDWEQSWLLVRASNTEPIVRIIAEAPSDDQARALCDRARGILEA